MGSQYLVFLIQFATSVIISRFFLAPAEVGLFSIALASAMMVSIFQDFGITRFVSGQPEMSDEKIGHCTTVSLGVSLIIVVLVLALASPVAAFYGEPRLAHLLWLVGASYLFVPFWTVSAALLARDMDYRALFAVNAGSIIVGSGVGLAMAASGYAAAALAWSVLAQSVVKAIIAQCFRRSFPRLPMSRNEAAPILGFGSSSVLLYVSAAIGVRSQDLLVGRIISIEAVGLFSRATALAGQLASLLTGAINAVFYPAFARKRDAGEPLAEPYVRLVASVTAINWAAMAGLCVAAEPLVLLLYGDKWRDVATLLQWTALAEMCFVAIPLHIDVPILLGRIKTLLWFSFADTTVVILFLVIGATIGVEQAAISRLCYGLVWIGIYARFQQSLIGFSTRTLITNYAKSGLCALIAATPMLLAYAFWRTPATLGFDGLLLTSGLGVIAWIAAIHLIRHPAAAEIEATIGHLFSRLRPARI